MSTLKGYVVRVDGPAVVHDECGDFGSKVPEYHFTFGIISERVTHGWGVRRLPGRLGKNFRFYEGPFSDTIKGRHIVLTTEDGEKITIFEKTDSDEERAVFYSTRGM